MSFSKEEIRLIVLCGQLMQVIDFGVDPSEVTAVKSFIKEHWSHDEAEYEILLDGIGKAIEEFRSAPHELEQRIGRLLDQVKAELSPDGIKLLFQLLHQVADADGRVAPQEAGLLRRFYSYLT